MDRLFCLDRTLTDEETLITDTHIHLQSLTVQQRQICLQQSRHRRYWTQSIIPSDWPILFGWMARYPHVKAAIGLHPWFLHLYADRLEIVMEKMASTLARSVSAGVGEIGLDFVSTVNSAPALQQAAFEHQLELAQSFGRPCSIHLRQAFPQAYAILKTHDMRRSPVFLHGFSGGPAWAEKFAALGCVIGVNGVVLRDNARRYHELVRQLPLSALALETDGPYVRMPGRASFDCHVVMDAIAARIARLRRMDREEVLAQCEKTVDRKLWQHESGQ